jgi:hypothetical protein
LTGNPEEKEFSQTTTDFFVPLTNGTRTFLAVVALAKSAVSPKRQPSETPGFLILPSVAFLNLWEFFLFAQDE